MFPCQIDDKFHDECGVIGIYREGAENITEMLCYGLIALQHRGQESAGIALNRFGNVVHYKEMGLVQDVFTPAIMQSLGSGDIGIGHVRYSTSGESYVANAQPLVVHYRGGGIALAHNGNLVNAEKLRGDLEDRGSIFSTTTDSEVIANLVARNYSLGYQEAIIKALEKVEGAYALVITCEDKLIGVRDPYGLRPLCLGKFADGGYILASESVAFDVVGAEFVRDIEKGEIIVIDGDGLHSYTYSSSKEKAICSFEYVYFARPDSTMDSRNIYESRREAGKILAKEHPVDADLVIAVPDSGKSAAIGYAQESGIPFGIGLIKNKYMGRTFIQPNQKMRELAVRLKLNVLKANVEGKRLVLIDDSIVRGTTSRRIVDMLKAAGAKEVHVRVSSPPVTHSCFFGIDTPSRKQLVAATHSIEQIKEMIHADSLGFISAEGLVESVGLGDNALCKACFTGHYPMPIPLKTVPHVAEKN